jgi:membrane fusion protein (multidrug efflux system)
VAVAALAGGAAWFVHSLHTVSTDDAYVNSHVTFVAPRVAGQVALVFVDDNNLVHKGDLLVRLDRVSYEVQVAIAEAAAAAGEADLVAARAQARALAGQTRAARYSLQHAIEEVDNQVALLHSKAATLAAQKATLAKAKFEYDRTASLVGSGALSRQDTELYKEAFLVAQAKVEEALQGVFQVRVSLGLSSRPESGDDLTQVPADLDQTFSSVKQSQMALAQAAAQLGATDSLNKSPRQMVADFYRRDPDQDIDRIYAELEKNAPAARQAEARLAQARRLLDQAKLNLSYCDVVAEIDGVVARRNVNPGNNVIAGQSVMAVRSLTDVWVDANFKETQLARLRIGQPADLDVDMYGGRQRFRGRVSGFSTGTGSTLALLPPENATGNFVKVVQRLPVRIELLQYAPEPAPLFAGLSVTASVRVDEGPTGPDAGKFLQARMEVGAPVIAPATVPATAPVAAPAAGTGVR